MKDYIELAQVTNTVNYHQGIGRLMTALILGEIIEAGEYLDAIKKNQFYGRETDDSRDIMENQAHQAIYNNEAFTEEVDFAAMFPNLTREQAIMVYHGMVGMITEAVEIAQALYKGLRGEGPIDTVNVLEECGDVQWYQASIYKALGVDFTHVGKVNIAKLEKRFGGKFDAFRAQQENRNLGAERKILEAGAVKTNDSDKKLAELRASPAVQAMSLDEQSDVLSSARAQLDRA